MKPSPHSTAIGIQAFSSRQPFGSGLPHPPPDAIWRALAANMTDILRRNMLFSFNERAKSARGRGNFQREGREVPCLLGSTSPTQDERHEEPVSVRLLF